MAINRKQLWRYFRGLAAPVLLWGLFVVVLIDPLQSWLRGDDRYDEASLREWIEEARVFRETLPEMVHAYLSDLDQARSADPASDPATDPLLLLKAEKIQEHLKSLGTPPTKMYPGQLPLFPILYRLQLRLVVAPGFPPQVIVWDSDLPRHPSQYRELHHLLQPSRAWVDIQYQLHAYNKRQRNEQASTQRLRWVTVLAVAGTAVALLWMFLVQHRERERERQRTQAQHQLDQAERRALEEELRRQEAEHMHQEAQHQLLEQRLATQAAERQALELKSQLYASIGIMAGSYAHNIKNLLVRPNDLLRRCLEGDSLAPDQTHMLREVRQTLGTVTERLQQILRTVRRDPSRSELTRLDLCAAARDLQRTWEDLASEKWKLTLTVELDSEALWIEGDHSHLQQAAENLLFNARDATFEMRNYLRDQARHQHGLAPAERRQALIDAAAWKGSVCLRTYQQGNRAILEVQDNGIGMTEEVRRRCTETHFSTKRDNAVYEGNSTGMGLGLSFVVAILEHHRARLEVESQPLRGAVFRASFPLLHG
jgi:signal transduction histidine kinase